ncbi:hypothetical protein BFP72_11220 [Reichenbachiella sp. 5M10]|uniref:DUF2306 domain-containing protein n=1 Tax=Reichenbachiella sp. 5M10 TaxID=1889772 RepID=UPI000C1592E6|nr:DUF2306 domain-containing protein [Reichenbachiella sp. 5M10]PIB35922.1 hypothetical protein BFP72_11220 [Reichenbachiella sp. 5M10]
MLDLSNWIHSSVGALHFYSSIIGLLTGAFLLLAPKGTRLHKTIGYLFSVSLLLVNLSALSIYDFNDGHPSVFHLLIPVSLFFLCYGLWPAFAKKRKPNWLKQHIIGMNGAALGLWAAGATEFFVRELSYGLTKPELILYSTLISVPFAVLIAISITYHIGRTSR